MRRYVLIGIGMLMVFTVLLTLSAAESGPLQKYEFVTIRWGGRENTHTSSGPMEKWNFSGQF